MSAGKSIVLVTVDCLRADHVGFMGYERPTTPFLDGLAGESIVFPAAIVAGAPTYYSFPGILASRYPLALGRDILGLAPEETTLASALQHAGYSTAAFVAGNPYLSSRFGYDRGFQTYRDFLEDEPAPLGEEEVRAVTPKGWASRINRKLEQLRPTLGPLGDVYGELYFRYCQHVTPVAKTIEELRRFPAADVIVDQACAWLASAGDAPVFLWLHLMDPHSPYYPKDEALVAMGDRPLAPYDARYLNCYWNRSDLGQRRLSRRREEVVRLYDAGIRWVDGQMKRLVETLRRERLWDDCIFACTGDHGEEFLDHGGRYHSPFKLTEELIRVPLLVRIPHAARKEMATSPFSLLHLAPTLLDAAEVPVPAQFQGQSCWKQMHRGGRFDGVAISECISGCTNPFRSKNRMGPRLLAVRESRFKLVLHFDPAAEHLYDLEADPGEQAPLPASAEKAVRRRLLETARKHLGQAVGQRDWRARVQARMQNLQLEWRNSPGTASSAAI